MSELTLYYFPFSSCSRKVLFSLYAKNLEFKSIIINLPAGEQRSPSFLAINPHGKIPVLRCEGQFIFDSAVILEFLEERFSHPALLPHDPLKKALVRKHTQYADQFFYPAISAILAEFRLPREQQDALKISSLIHTFNTQHLPYLDKLMNARNSNFLFDNLSVADLAFAMGLIRLKEVAGSGLNITTATQDWIQFIQDLPPYKKLNLHQPKNSAFIQGATHVAN